MAYFEALELDGSPLYSAAVPVMKRDYFREAFLDIFGRVATIGHVSLGGTGKVLLIHQTLQVLRQPQLTLSSNSEKHKH